jgi:hypothetical protein
VRTRFEGDDRGASTGGLAGLAERHDLRVRRACAVVETLADDRAGLIEDDGADAWVGVGERSAGGKLEGTTHQRDIALMLWCVDLAVCHVLSLVLDS